MKRASACLLFFLIFQSIPLSGQRRVDLRNTYERLLCVVPMVGAGTPSDPRRPLYAPLPGAGAPSREGIIAFSYVASDDGRLALVEFVARDRAAFEPILTENRADVKAFLKGKATRSEIEKEFRLHKKDFDLERFGASVP